MGGPTRRWAVLGLAAALATATLVAAGTSSAALDTASGNAYGIAASGVVNVTATPQAHNPGGPTTNSQASATVGSIVSTGVLDVSATGNTSSGPTSTATVNNTSVSATLGTGISLSLGATVISSTCSVDTNGVGSASTTLTGASASVTAGLVNVPITLSASTPNTTVSIPNPLNLNGPALGSITLNAQSGVGSPSVSVDAIEISLLPGTALAQTITIAHADCAATIASLAAQFRSFDAREAKHGVRLAWRTASQVDVAGYNVYREVRGHKVRLNSHLIPARASGRYSFLDHARKAGARYWLQTVNLDGSRSWHGPARLVARRLAA